MKKKLFYVIIVFTCVFLAILFFYYNRKESNSEKWDGTESQEVISDYESLYGCDFEIATREFENKIYGIWQVKDFVGWDSSSRYQWAGFYGDILIFCENAWISDGTPWYKPVYACYSAGMSELASEQFLNITWADDRYDDQNGILTIAVCTERNQNFGDALDHETFSFILSGDVIIMEKNGSYWELEKVGELEMTGDFSNGSATGDGDYDEAVRMLNQDLFNADSVNWAYDMIAEGCYNFSEEVKGEFEPNTDCGDFPKELVIRLEGELYRSIEHRMEEKRNWDDIYAISYFEVLREYGCEEFALDLDDMYRLFPELEEYGETFDSEYQAYRYISGSENCLEMFYFHMTPGEENYLFAVSSGGSNGAVTVELTKRTEDGFIPISSFETQGSGYGRVIECEGDFYYACLEKNYNLSVVDGIRIHRLGENARSENLLIRYLPDQYFWKDISRTGGGMGRDFHSTLDTYMESLKEEITSDRYMEQGGYREGPDVFYGDETEITALSDMYDQYYEIDFANIGVPVYMRKSNFISSGSGNEWFLRARFYVADPEEETVENIEDLEELENLRIENYEPPKSAMCLVQLWFKEIEGQVVTFRLYHVSDYNYLLNVILIEESHITQIKTAVCSPHRTFVLLQGQEFTTMG